MDPLHDPLHTVTDGLPRPTALVVEASAWSMLLAAALAGVIVFFALLGWAV